MPMTAAALLGAIGGLIALVVIFKMVWRVAEPNEALIISGLGARSHNKDTADSLGFKIVTGKGTVVLPGFQTSRRLRLDSRAANLEVSCVTQQGIPVHVRGVVIYKVGDDLVSIANAARRFLEQQKSMDGAIHELFTGHLRSIIGNLTVEDLILNRERLTSEARGSAADEMSKLGLIVDSLQIQEIDDSTGYISNIGRPHAAKVAAAARIAEAERDQEATQREQEAAALNAAAIRDSRIKQAAAQAEIDAATARQGQAGPLAEAEAKQQVVVQETRAAELEAERAEKQLLTTVRKPADAKAYETVTLAEAEREAQIKRAQAEAEAIRVSGEAEASAVRAKGLAEAESIKARAEALAQNQEAVIAQQLAENWAEIVMAGAEAFNNIDNMVVLNGTDGIQDMLAKALTMGGTGLGVARQLLASMGPQPPAPAPLAANGSDAPPPPIERAE
ncbi:flotillin family protein [Actinomadura craniellae]|uniref:Flotillin family protein n=1 Tax=Actinomadura craniellae TaxID=2231787 RepID=A0A365H609_9ACTN|nr:flotillin family protein [Actinomadura craniellae]RAY14535.1 flotillin family protein [Actinomadura craniellae]